jgi:hypothetical protein
MELSDIASHWMFYNPKVLLITVLSLMVSCANFYLLSVYWKVDIH